MTDLAMAVLDAFPAGNYALSALLRLLDIVESDEVPTAAVECRAQPRLLVNPGFRARHAATPERLLMLVMHELHHVLLGHTRLFPCANPRDNFVFDCVINALIARMLPAPEHVGLLTGFYAADRFPECLLRPPPEWNGRAVDVLPVGIEDLPPAQRDQAAHVYRALYSEGGATYDEIFRLLPSALRLRDDVAAVPLLGGHDGAASPDAVAQSPALLGAVRAIVEDWPNPPQPIRGRSLDGLVREARVAAVPSPSARTLLRGLLRRIAGDGTGRALDDRMTPSTILSGVPALERRTLVQTALGARPLLFPAQVHILRRVRSGERVHVYLDVSGSMDDVLPALYGALGDCRTLIHPAVHLFSTDVRDVGIADLLRGVRWTTGGTSIDCVADHMAQHRVRRACLVTDGWVGRPRGSRRKTLQAARIAVAYAGGGVSTTDLDGLADHVVHLPIGDRP